MARKPRHLNVGVRMHRVTEDLYKMLEGIARYVYQMGRPWLLHTHPETYFPPLPPIDRWKGDGLIALVADQHDARTYRNWHGPVVNISQAVADHGLPLVGTDNLAVGRLAAEYFMQRGFKHFGYCSYPGRYMSELRWQGFAARLAEAGFTPTCHEIAGGTNNNALTEEHNPALRQWLMDMPKPVAVFAAHDIRAKHVLWACGQAHIAVPEEVAVLGVDNTQIRCLLADPPLSSIELPFDTIGYEAARMLDNLMSGRSSARRVLLPPRQLVTRSSTNIMAIHDANVRQALHFINEHACRPLGVQDVLDHVSCSRRLLEQRFTQALGRSPGDEILRVRLAQVKRLLSETDMTMAEIAQRTGFCAASDLSRTFRRKVGQTPTAYRRMQRHGT